MSGPTGVGTGYWSASRAPVHSLAAVAPLVLLHAGLTWIFRPNVEPAAAGWVEWPLLRAGLSPLQCSLVLAAGFLVAGLALSARDIVRRRVRPDPRIIPLIWLEGAGWGLLLHLAWNGLSPPSRLPGIGKGDELALGLGAGIYEELVFRVAIFGACLAAARWAFGTEARRPADVVARGSAILVTSLLFAFAHHLGSEPVRLGAVVFRTVAAVFLTTLYAFRGLGVAVVTHAAYDISVALF